MLKAPLINVDSPSQAAETPAATSVRKVGAKGAALSVLAVVLLGCSYVALIKPAGERVLRGTELIAAAGHDGQRPPLFRITASSHFDAGLQHGRLARPRIMGWFSTPEMRSVFAFVAGSGSEAFAQLKRDNEAEYPEYVEEMRGIAEGAGVSLDKVWCANLLNELEGIMAIRGTPAVHCSDIYAVAPGGYDAGFAHGHNDDWSDAAKPWWYLTSFTYKPDGSSSNNSSSFPSCAGVTYPAALVGWAPTWNGHGLFSTQNSMVPRRQRAGGLACAFVQKRAICPSRSLEEAALALSVPGWSDGASMNIVDVRGKKMANVELWEDRHSILEVTNSMGNYSHFNEYKHLETKRGKSIDDPRIFLRDARQSNVDALPAPRSEEDVKARLTTVFRPDATITTLVVNGSTGKLSLWYASPSATSNPVYSWDMLHFFD